MVVSKFDPSVLASGKTRVTGMCVYASIVCTFLTNCLFFIFSLKEKRKETRKKCWRVEGLGSGGRVEEKKSRLSSIWNYYVSSMLCKSS